MDGLKDNIMETRQGNLQIPPGEAPGAVTTEGENQPKDKLAADKLTEDKLAEDKLAEDKLPEDRRAEDKLAADKLAACTARARGGNIIFFDGVCGLCDHFVQLVLDHDKTGKFLFCPLQSDFAKQKLAAHGIKSSELGSVVLILDCGEPAEAAYTKSEAALRILGALDKSTPLVLLKYSLILPAFLRNFGYDLVASNRYKVFGRLETCRIPLPEERQRFLDL